MIFDQRQRPTAIAVLSAIPPSKEAVLVYSINHPARLREAQSMLDVLNRRFLYAPQEQKLLGGHPITQTVTAVACVPAICFFTFGNSSNVVPPTRRGVSHSMSAPHWMGLRRRDREEERRLFHTAALLAGTDKVSLTASTTPKMGGNHHYDLLYAPHLSPRRKQAISLLEIGLGCSGGGSGAGTKPGRSAALWMTYLPRANVTILEFSGVCVQTWKEAVRRARDDSSTRVAHALQTGRLRVKVGSQADPTDLAELTEPAEHLEYSPSAADPRKRALLTAAWGAPFDVAIDDGGHENRLMLPAFAMLWPHVAPGV